MVPWETRDFGTPFNINIFSAKWQLKNAGFFLKEMENKWHKNGFKKKIAWFSKSFWKIIYVEKILKIYIVLTHLHFKISFLYTSIF